MFKLKLRQAEVLQALRMIIRSGEWRTGQRLPPEQELVARFGVSRPTIRLVLDQLADDGLIQTLQGNGRKIRGRVVLNGQPTGDILAKSIVLLSSSAHALSDPRRELGGRSELAVDAAITTAIQRCGWHCLNVAANNLSPDERDNLVAGRPAGFLATEAIAQSIHGREFLDALVLAGFPVTTAGSLPELARFDRVYSDHKKGAFDLAQWLIDRGCRRIAVVGSKPTGTYWVDQRIQGCTQALARAKLSAPRVIYIPGKEAGDSSEDIQHKIHRFTSYLTKIVFGSKPVDAVMALTDWDANIVQQALVDMHKKQDVEIIVTGYDNLWASIERRFGPGRPAATIDKMNIDIGEAMVRLIIDRIEGRLPSSPQQRVILPRMVITKPLKTKRVVKGIASVT